MTPGNLRIAAIRAKGKPYLSQADLSSIASYDPETGLFTATKPRGGLRVGDTMGTLRPDGYVDLFVRYWGYRAHRLAFLAMEGEMPPPHLHVDHINHIRSDNRWCNLRLLEPALNSAHRSPEHRASSGHRGVYELPSGKFQAALEHKGQRHRLGCFECREDAIAARCDAERHWFGDAKAQLLKYGAGQ